MNYYSLNSYAPQGDTKKTALKPLPTLPRPQARQGRPKEKAELSDIVEAFAKTRDIYLQVIPTRERDTVNIYKAENCLLQPVTTQEIARHLQLYEPNYTASRLTDLRTHIKYMPLPADRDLSPAQIDNHRLLCKNYVIEANLSAGKPIFTKREHYRGKPFFHETDFNYIPNCTEKSSKVFSEFLDSFEVTPGIRRAICEGIGLNILPLANPNMPYLYILLGPGANGKSVIIDFVGHIVGGRAYFPRLRDLDGTANPFGAAKLIKKNAVLIHEAKGGSLDTETLKAIASGNRFAIEGKFLEQTEIGQSISFLAACNTLPPFKEDGAVGRRVITIPLHKIFDGKARKKDMLERLLADRDPIASCCVDYALAAAYGKTELSRCKEEAAAALDADELGLFIKTYFHKGAEGEGVDRPVIVEKYLEYLEAQGLSLEDNSYLGRDGKAKGSGGFFKKFITRAKEIFQTVQIKEKQVKKPLHSFRIAGIGLNIEPNCLDNVPIPTRPTPTAEQAEL